MYHPVCPHDYGNSGWMALQGLCEAPVLVMPSERCTCRLALAAHAAHSGLLRGCRRGRKEDSSKTRTESRGWSCFTEEELERAQPPSRRILSNRMAPSAVLNLSRRESHSSGGGTTTQLCRATSCLPLAHQSLQATSLWIGTASLEQSS